MCTNNRSFLILISLREIPDWISFHISLRRMEALSLSSEERSGLIEKGGLSDPLFARMLDTSEDLISLTKIGQGRWEEESNFPKQNL